MKCSQCKFVCSDKKDICPKCQFDLRPHKKALGIRIVSPNASYEELLVLEQSKESGKSPEVLEVASEAPENEQSTGATEASSFGGLFGKIFGKTSTAEQAPQKNNQEDASEFELTGDLDLEVVSQEEFSSEEEEISSESKRPMEPVAAQLSSEEDLNLDEDDDIDRVLAAEEEFVSTSDLSDQAGDEFGEDDEGELPSELDAASKTERDNFEGALAFAGENDAFAKDESDSLGASGEQQDADSLSEIVVPEIGGLDLGDFAAKFANSEEDLDLEEEPEINKADFEENDLEKMYVDSVASALDEATRSSELLADEDADLFPVQAIEEETEESEDLGEPEDLELPDVLGGLDSSDDFEKEADEVGEADEAGEEEVSFDKIPEVSPEVVEFGDDDTGLEAQLDEMIGDLVFDVEAVKVEKPEKVDEGDDDEEMDSFLVDDDLEISIEVEIDGDEGAAEDEEEDEEYYEDEGEEVEEAALSPEDFSDEGLISSDEGADEDEIDTEQILDGLMSELEKLENEATDVSMVVHPAEEFTEEFTEEVAEEVVEEVVEREETTQEITEDVTDDVREEIVEDVEQRAELVSVEQQSIVNPEIFVLPALENFPFQCLRGYGVPPGANILLTNTARADQALGICGNFKCEGYILPALENSLLKCLRGLGAPPGGTANIGLANTAKADQALDNCGILKCEAYIPPFTVADIGDDKDYLINELLELVSECYGVEPNVLLSSVVQAASTESQNYEMSGELEAKREDELEYLAAESATLSDDATRGPEVSEISSQSFDGEEVETELTEDVESEDKVDLEYSQLDSELEQASLDLDQSLESGVFLLDDYEQLLESEDFEEEAEVDLEVEVDKSSEGKKKPKISSNLS